MALVTVNDTTLTDIADAIRSKNGQETLYKPSEMPDAIEAISGGITPTGTKEISITSNGTTTEDVTSYASAEVTVNVPASAVDSGTKSISSNGTHDVVGYASASVSVPNSYSAGDEGKVVSNGALVAQTSDTVTTNDTYDTTLINSLTVNVSGGGTPGAEFLWANTVEVVTVGANSVTNTQAAYQYFSSYTFKYLILLSPLTVNNQYVSWANGASGRYKNGAIDATTTGANYDAKLIEGSQYLLLSD